MYPHKMERNKDGEMELVYKVSDGGSTLRDFITKLHTTKPIKRISFRKEKAIDPLELLLEMIDVYDSLLSSNKITNQSFINPDLIWITKEHHVKVIFTWDMDLITDRNLKLYWSPELLGKHTQLMYANIDAGVQRQQTLKRYDTRPSTMSCVYSLGLVFYFMITGHDPYDGHRIHVYDRPDMTFVNHAFGRLIWNATESDVKQRPTMKEWREMVEGTKGTKGANGNNCILL
jgi:serine/threonine protein kinase